MFQKGLVHIYYGYGQGKTSAAVGLAARNAGRGGRVLFAQFLKNGASSELNSLKRLGPEVEVLECKPCTKFFYCMDDGEKRQAICDVRETLDAVRQKAASGEYDLLVLDEILDVVELQMIQANELVDFLLAKPIGLEVVLTGHQLPEELEGIADYITEMRKVKHPYDSGVGARAGAEM